MFVIPFLIFVLRRFRRELFTGFRGDESWTSSLCQAPILSHFGQADNPRRLVASDGESMFFAFAFHDDLHVKKSCWIQVSLTFFPLQGLTVSRYPGEEAFPHSQRIGNWLTASPNIEYQVVKVRNFASRPPFNDGLERTDHTRGTGLVSHGT